MCVSVCLSVSKLKFIIFLAQIFKKSVREQSDYQNQSHTVGAYNRHEHGLTRIIRRQSLPRYIAIYNSSTQVRDRHAEL